VYAVLRRAFIDLSWRNYSDGICTACLVPEDVLTREGAEYLLAIASDGVREQIWLDRILKANWAAMGEPLDGVASDI